MEGVGNGARPLHGHGRGKVAVYAQDPRRLVANRVGIEMDDLPVSMNAGIGTPGCDDGRGPRRDPAQCALEAALDRRGRMSLALPALKGRSDILDP
jgi:hypothetical protein